MQWIVDEAAMFYSLIVNYKKRKLLEVVLTSDAVIVAS